jgi:peptidoglycan/xylan/chitin deacetylase (PgdA/CDA1 family)
MRPRQIVFLMYHELERPGRPLCQSEPGYVRYILGEPDFRDQMQWLKAEGWQGLSVGQALGYPEGQSVAITFDDGCETDLLLAAPILRETKNNATFYVTAGFLGWPGYLSPAQLRELSGLGFEIGCHSMTHAYLNDLDESGLRREIVEAKRRIEDIIGKPVEHFSCPGGRCDDRAVEVARNAGYRSMANSRVGANSISTDQFQLARVAILRGTTPQVFGEICRDRGLWRSQASKSLRDYAKTVLGNSLYDRCRRLLLSGR